MIDEAEKEAEERVSERVTEEVTERVTEEVTESMVKSVIEACMDLGASREETMERLTKKMNLSPETAETYIRQCWIL